MVTLAYAELLRRYGTPGLVSVAACDAVAWMRENLGAFPRPLAGAARHPRAGVGPHQRARRRQGWWVCAFGVAATAPRRHLVLATRGCPSASCLLTELYTLRASGWLIGYVVIRLDLALTGSRGRGGRRAEEASAVRPEPRRTQALL